MFCNRTYYRPKKKKKKEKEKEEANLVSILN